MVTRTNPKEHRRGPLWKSRCGSSRRGVVLTSGLSAPTTSPKVRLALREELFFAVISAALTQVFIDAQISPESVWDSPRVKAILEQPGDAPIDLSQLTVEEINALARGAKGIWAEHPDIGDSVEWVRSLRENVFRQDVE